MANLLKMANTETIHTLHQQGWSQRRIARELGMNRETVARCIARTQNPKPANAPIGSDLQEDRQFQLVSASESSFEDPLNVERGRASNCEPRWDGFRTGAGRISLLSGSTRTWLLRMALLGVTTLSDASFGGSSTRYLYPFGVPSPSEARRLRLILVRELG